MMARKSKSNMIKDYASDILVTAITINIYLIYNLIFSFYVPSILVKALNNLPTSDYLYNYIKFLF